MELLQNNSFLEKLNWNSTKTDTEFDNAVNSELSAFFNVLEANISGNKTEERQTLYVVPTAVVVVLSLFYGAICITAILGNFLVICLVMTSKRMRTVTHLFIANLALADIAIAIFCIPFQFQAALLQKWNLPHFLCAVCPFVQVLTVTVSILTLVIIALDRYRAVVHPLKAKLSKKMGYVTILAIWVFSFLLALPTELDYSVTKMAKSGRTIYFCSNVNLPTTFRIYYNQGIVIIQYFFPLFIISKAYIRISRTLLKSGIPGNQEKARDAFVLRKKTKIIKKLFTVVSIFALCWFPLQSYNFLSMGFPSINSFKYINILWFGFHWLAMSNSCCNPFIYAFFNHKFKKELFKYIPCLARFQQENRLRVTQACAQMCNHVHINCKYVEKEKCEFEVIYNPIQANLHKVNADKISEEVLYSSTIEVDVNMV